MTKYRLVIEFEDGDSIVYPEFSNPMFFGLLRGPWKRFNYWSGCESLGLNYEQEDKYFDTLSGANEFLENVKSDIILSVRHVTRDSNRIQDSVSTECT